MKSRYSVGRASVHLTPELEELVQKKVKTGRYSSASEVVREALRLLAEYDDVRATQFGELRSRIDAGLASLDRGEGVDGELFMGRLVSGLSPKPARRKIK
ncbi:MAG: type II toxin-antitoxin system ParD family antitoxin [Bryobacteraceae bacterium]